MKRRIIIFAFLIALLISVSGEAILSAFSLQVSAETREYSDVLDDLSKDASFNPDNYPAIADDYSLKVIQIAEGSDGELFVYVYQPSGVKGKLRATSINISTSVRTKNIFKNYTLSYLNSDGVFYKYIVNDFKVSDNKERHYEISSIFRAWNSDYDKEAEADNTISEVPFIVGKQYVFNGFGSEIECSVSDIEYIKIENKFVGYIRYYGDTLGILPSYIKENSTDAHFVAFSTDREIDKLLEADVYYKSQVYHSYKNGFSFSTDPWGEVKENYKYLDYEQKSECDVSDGSIFIESKHIWDRIQTTEEFLNSDVSLYAFPGFDITEDINFTENAKEALSNTKWVLSFVETRYNWQSSSDGYDYDNYFVRVGDVSIVRLKYVTDGVTYDLGVIDNKQTGSNDPAGTVEQQEWWQKIMSGIMFLIVLMLIFLLSGPASVVIKILLEGVKILISVLLWVIKLPFKLLHLMFRK